MNNSILISEDLLQIDSNKSVRKKRKLDLYEIMHMDKVVATISSNGKAKILEQKFLPYDLYLDDEDEDNIDILINNLENFNHWCASRVLSLDRKYAKELL